MKRLIWLPSLCAAILAFSGCANQNSLSGNDPLGTGPFDSRGNYREDWADDPTKWRKPGSRQTASADDLPVVAANERPPADSTPLAPARTSSPKPSTASTAVVKPAPVTVAAKPKPKPVAAKPKPKPTVTRHVVKKGDTLSGIASRYGSSVGAIQRANGISGSLIFPGKSLVIPKR